LLARKLKKEARGNALQVHEREYLERFNDGTLDPKRTRQIGFGEITSQPVLIDRTKAEVAGGRCPGCCVLHRALRPVVFYIIVRS
jgi:hypothetical protein